jgi:hypothetical protein
MSKTGLNITSLDSLEFGSSLKAHDNIHSIIQLLIERIKLIPQSESLQLNVDLIIWICNAIDNILLDSKLKNVDKYELFVTIYKTIFPETTDKEMKTVEAIITYLHHIKVIAAVSKTPWAKIARYFKSCVKIILGALSISS